MKKHILSAVILLMILLLVSGCEFVDRPPIADAGSSINGYLNEAVTLQGSSSEDPDGREITAQWSFVLKPDASQLSDSSITSQGDLDASFIPDAVGLYVVLLQISDGRSWDEAVVTVQITIRPEAPGVPENLTCFNHGDRSIALSWDPVAGAERYEIFRDTEPAGSYSTKVYDNKNTVAVDTSLTPETTYYYRIRAVNTYGEGAYSAVASGSTVAVILRLPEVPIDPDIGIQTSSSLTLLWDAPSYAEWYRAYRSTLAEGPFTLKVYEGASRTFVDPGLSAGTRYYYRITAGNLAGEGDPTAIISELTKPDPPDNLEISSPTASSLILSWDAAFGASSYTVYRALSASGSYSSLGATAGTTFTDTTCSSGTTYYYKIKSENSSGLSIYSDIVSGLTIPGVPNKPEVGAAAASSLQLEWDYVRGSSSYILSTASSADFSDESIIYSGSAEEYTHSGLSGGTAYYYRLKAQNSSGTGAVSEVLAALTRPQTPDPLTQVGASANSITIGWDGVTGADRYYLYRDSSATGTFTTQVYSGSAVGHTDTGRTAGTAYYYKIKAENDSGFSPLSGAFTMWTQALPPLIPVLAGKGADFVNLSWSSQIGADSYVIYRSTAESGPFTATGNTAGTVFSDTGLLSGATYYYRVSSVNTAGEGNTSAVLAVTLD